MQTQTHGGKQTLQYGLRQPKEELPSRQKTSKNIHMNQSTNLSHYRGHNLSRLPIVKQSMQQWH